MKNNQALKQFWDGRNVSPGPKTKTMRTTKTNKKPEIMTYTAEQIANYISKNINLTPNSNWTIYEGPSGLCHTSGSMEYRGDEHRAVMNFFTMDEAPEDMEALIDSVEFQMNN